MCVNIVAAICTKKELMFQLVSTSLKQTIEHLKEKKDCLAMVDFICDMSLLFVDRSPIVIMTVL